MKKLLLIALPLFFAFSLQGCGLQKMVVKDASNKPINGFDIEISNYNKITDKKINLSFTLDENSDIGEFPWVETQNKIKQHLKNKGVILSSEGRPVTITLNSFSIKGSNYAKSKPTNNNILASSVTSLGGTLLEAVAVGMAERKITKLTEDKTKGDGRNFVPALKLTIQSNDYKTTLKMSFIGAISNYFAFSSKVSASAMSEFFVPK